MRRKTEAEVVAEVDDNFERRAVADDPTELVRNRGASREPSQVYSVRIPAEALELLRDVANARGVAPSALMRAWVLERLRSETSGEEIRMTREELERVVREQMEAVLRQAG